ncbi:MAG: HAD-IC family P-type ATPase [Candidatus Latescibacteria bacterium]|nr:HAD-IC family P-type ATPase [Candidatus Latescibacterota bacterium]
MTAPTSTPVQSPCFHCGQPCRAPYLCLADKPFCCTGCRTVYQLLRDNDMERYYALAQRPGTAPSSRSASHDRFAYLDSEPLQTQLLDYADDERARITLHLPQIHCPSCIWLLENLPRLEAGVLHAEVDFLRRQITLVYHRQYTAPSRLAALLARLGYEPEIALDQGQRPKTDPETKKLVKRLAVAGFCFGNAMLFSFPEYLAEPGGLQQSWSWLFAALNIALALPVLLYSSTPFLMAAWASLRSGRTTIDVPIALGIAALFGRSIVHLLEGGIGYIDSFTGLVFLLLIGRLVQRRTFAALTFDRDYRSYFPLAATALIKGRERSLALADLQPGHIIRVRHDELIPTDCRLQSDDCQLDYSYVTGEAALIPRRAGAMLYAGGRLCGKTAQMEVVEPVSQSYLTRLWNGAAFQAPQPSRFRPLLDAISRYFTAAVLTLAAAAALYWLPQGWERAADVATAVLIIACPCALALSMPFALGTAVNALGRAGLYLKNADIVEQLARIDTVVFDKTGTLTSSRNAEVDFIGAPLDSAEKDLLAAALSNSTHPLSRRIVPTLAIDQPPAVAEFSEFTGQGLYCLCRGHKIMAGSPDWLQSQGLDLPRTPVGTVVCIALDGLYRGHFQVRPAYRPGLQSLFAALAQRAELYLLSGDGDGERTHLQTLFPRADRLHFAQTPAAKLDFVAALAQQGRAVLMVGDGLNDAGALRQSAVGLAVSEDTSSFSPACDGILAAHRLDALPAFLALSRAAVQVAQISMGLSLAYNAVGLTFALQGRLSPLLCAVLMPLSSLTIIAFTTLAARLAARRAGICP